MAELVEPIEILLAEDNPGDIRLTQQALKDSKMHNNLHVVNDGEQAVSFLRRLPPYENAPRPGLFLLDLNMPKKDGREVLEEMKGDPELRSIPTVVLTTSEAEQDVVSAYQLHANAYITKPVDFDQFVNVVKGIQDFWLTIVRLPPG
ncbi:MAG: response regulator [Actinomycetota bacterium]|nr:response regulator [Actinomycetota bacterium]